MSEMKIQHITKYVVRPATPAIDHLLSLNNLDRIPNPTFSSAILIYTNVLVRSDTTFAEMMQSLKRSLALVLVHFYPLAGRLVLRQDGLMDLECHDQGAVVIEALVDAALEDFGGPQPMPALSGLEFAGLGTGPRYVPDQDQLPSVPTLVIQVTRFKKCGSIAVVVNWHHAVADGFSGCHFMRSWSELALGNKLTLKPDHNWQQLAPRTPLDSSLFRSFSERSTPSQVLCPRLDSPLPSSPVVLQSFPLAKKAILDLKAQIKTETCEYTSIESVSGHLWKVMTKARAKVNDSSDHKSHSQVTKFSMFVEGRKKLGLPAGYFGNVVCTACAVGNEEDITSESSSYAANLIKEVTRSISGEYFKSLIDWVEEHAQAPPKSNYLNSLGHDVAATFWTRFPIYELDFGWGRPNFASRNSASRPLIDGIAMMPSQEGNGNMVAILNLHLDRMVRLKQDPDFVKLLAKSSGSHQHSQKHIMILNNCILKPKSTAHLSVESSSLVQSTAACQQQHLPKLQKPVTLQSLLEIGAVLYEILDYSKHIVMWSRFLTKIIVAAIPFSIGSHS